VKPDQVITSTERRCSLSSLSYRYILTHSTSTLHSRQLMTCSGGSDPGQGCPEPCHSKPDVSWLLLRYEISGFHTQRYKVILNTFQYYRGGFAPLAPPGDLPPNPAGDFASDALFYRHCLCSLHPNGTVLRSALFISPSGRPHTFAARTAT